MAIETRTTDIRIRCPWATTDSLTQAYHDTEWGTPVHGDDAIFERLSLEGFQAGLSWATVLRKREHFREAFAGFSVETVAEFGDDQVDELLGNPRIIRNRAKIAATIGNARAALTLPGGLSEFVWSHAPQIDDPIVVAKEKATALSDALRAQKFRFVGPVTVYSTFQAIGAVNDHEPGCFLAVAPLPVLTPIQ